MVLASQNGYRSSNCIATLQPCHTGPPSRIEQTSVYLSMDFRTRKSPGRKILTLASLDVAVDNPELLRSVMAHFQLTFVMGSGARIGPGKAGLRAFGRLAQQLNEAVVITRSTSGPVGLYIVSVGHFVAEVPGAIAGWLAMITPAVLIIPLVEFAGRKLEHPRVKGMLQTVIIASAGLLLAASIPLARDALTDPVTVAIAVVSLVLLLVTELDTLWIILGAAVVSLSASSLGVLARLSV
jgi:chromate transporter